MPIIHSANKPIQIDLDVIKDPLLSHSALGLYVRILYCNERIPKEDRCFEGMWQDEICEHNRAFNELVEKGYLTQEDQVIE